MLILLLSYYRWHSGHLQKKCWAVCLTKCLSILTAEWRNVKPEISFHWPFLWIPKSLLMQSKEVNDACFTSVTLILRSTCNTSRDTLYQSGWSFKDEKIQPWLQHPCCQVLPQGQSRPSLSVKYKASQGYHHQCRPTDGLKYCIQSCWWIFCLNTWMCKGTVCNVQNDNRIALILIPTSHDRMLHSWLWMCKIFIVILNLVFFLKDNTE